MRKSTQRLSLIEIPDATFRGRKQQKPSEIEEELTMNTFLETVSLFILMPIFIIANLIHTQKKIRQERELAEKENIAGAEKHWY